MKTRLLCMFSAVTVALIVHVGAATAGELKQRITGIYSDLTYHEESGDVLGDEVFVVFSNQGYFVVFQGSEGAPYRPVVVPAQVDGASISFVLPPQVDPRGAFSGQLVNDELVGTFKNNGQSIRLKKRASYWQ